MDQAIEEGVADLEDETLLSDKDARKRYLEEKLWRPVYSEYEFDPEGQK
jgi:hypothetical protein